MTLEPTRLRRRLGHGGISLLVLATSSSLLWTVSSGTASARVTAQPVCSQGVCEVTFGPTDVPAVQTFKVPTHVTSVTATVDGAGGGRWDGSIPGVLAGAGGETTGTFPAKGGDQLSLVVGGAGESAGDSSSGAAGGYGGGGAGGSNALSTGAGTGGGGGGSFLLGSTGAVLLAAGGGGGASADRSGGSGGSALAPATAGGDGDGSSLGGQPGSAGSNGLGGTPNGGAGTGALTSATVLPLGGKGGNTLPNPSPMAEPGAGGGGGYHAGGGGGGSAGQINGSSGYGAGGGGGSGFAAAAVTAVSGQAGVQAGNGRITLSYSVPQPITFTSSFDAVVVGATGYSVSAEQGGQPPVVFSIDPATTNAACSLSGRASLVFAHVGTCVIAADEAGDDQHVAGHKTLSFPVRVGSQAITFTPLASKGSIGDTLPLRATTDSGLPVTFDLASTSTAGACSLDGTSLTLTAVGTCAVTASQPGTDDYTPAQPVTQLITVARVATTPVLTFDEDAPVFGQDVTASVAVPRTVAGSVQFLVDDRAVGFPVAVDPAGTASVTLPALEAGSHPVKVTFTPTDSATYAVSSVVRSLPVAKAKTNIEIAVRADEASVKVIAVAPGKGVPGGSVVFTFGSTTSTPVDVVRGEATYAGSIPLGTVVRVAYSGDADFAGSSTSTLRRNPVITATVTSTSAQSPTGWYRGAVTVSFHCEPGSAPVVGDCPDPVVLASDGASQDVSETIAADDGGLATVSVTGINIDTVKPEVDALGITEGDRFFSSAPDAGCTATDTLSGVLRCSASRSVKDQAVTYSVTATDQAGNVTTRTVHATTYVRGITDAPYVDGAYSVRAGQTYTLVAKSSKRPQVLKPTLAPKKPSKKGDKFKATANDDEWALGYTMPTSLQPGKTYNLGIRTSSKKYTIKVTVTP